MLTEIIKVLFWLVVGVILYVYFGYPLLLIMASMIKKNKPVNKVDIIPSVSLIVAAHNEEKTICQKLENSLNLNYPKDKLEIIVASDGSTDKTDAMVKKYSLKFENIKLNAVKGRSGKNIALNKTISMASGDIIVFSDASSMYERDCIKKLVRHFARKEVGCVVGRLKYVDERSNIGQGENLYWRYESFIRNLEGRLKSVLTASGSVLAIRSELYPQLEFDVPNDLQIPIEIGIKNYEVIYEPEAMAMEKQVNSLKEEFSQKVRTINRGLVNFLKLRNKIKGVWLFEFISHKLLRWLTGVFLILVFSLNIFLIGSNFYKVILLLQLVFYGFAGTGIYLQWRRIRCRGFYIPFYFCLVNLAALIALFEFLAGKRYSMWETSSAIRLF